jgi:hypothetical protein
LLQVAYSAIDPCARDGTALLEVTRDTAAHLAAELLCSSERLRMQADGLQQLLERLTLTHLSIIIDNE